jgi:hypothetical protein
VDDLNDFGVRAEEMGTHLAAGGDIHGTSARWAASSVLWAGSQASGPEECDG